MSCSDRGHRKHDHGHYCKCGCFRCHSEYDCMSGTKYIYTRKTDHVIENRASIRVEEAVFWSNKVVAKKIVNRQI